MKRFTGSGALLVAATLPFGIAAAEETASSATIFFTGIEFSNQDSHRFDLGLGFDSAGGTSIDLAGSRTEAELGAADFSSTYTSGKLTHDFGGFGFGAGVRHTRDEDFSKTLGWVGTAFVDAGITRLSATFESRSTDFDDTPFAISGADLGLTEIGTISGLVACSVDSRGYGAGLQIAQPQWSVYGSATAFDYSSSDCRASITSVTGGTGTPIRLGPQILSRLATRVTNRLSGYSSRRLPRDAALLESSIMAGASFTPTERATLGLEVYRDSEEFAAATTNTLLTYLGISLTSTLTADLTLGTSQTDGLDDTAFAGLQISATIGN
jgi:hypothetical protein